MSRLRTVWMIAAAGLLLAVLGGCATEKAPDSGLVPCDPLQTTYSLTTLGTLIALGEDANGKVYLVDELPKYTLRLFVSDGDELVRVPLAGTGDGGGYYHVSVAEQFSSWELAVDGGNPDTAVVTVTSGPDSEVLTNLDPAVLDGFTLRDLPGYVEIVHAFRASDERILVITKPFYEGYIEDYRLFLGPEDSVNEYPLLEFSRGGGDYITFDHDGVVAEVLVPDPAVAMDWAVSGPTLSIERKGFALTELTGDLERFQYRCIAAN